MNIAIVEDQESWQRELRRYTLGCFKDTVIVQCFESGRNFLASDMRFDIVLMDVELENEDGFQVGYEYKKAYPEGILIFVTMHAELSRIGYRVNAFRYVDKAHPDELTEALRSAEAKFIQCEYLKLHVVSKGDISVLYKDILYIETYERNIQVYTGRGSYICLGNISKLAGALKEYGFFYVHRSFLVNVEAIDSFSRKSITLKNGKNIDISSKRYGNFKEYFFEWKFNPFDLSK